MNIHNLEKNISSAKLKSADKVILREVEEEKNNRFIAFADEGDVSFDIVIEIDSNGDLVDNNCDCGNNGFCLHEIALLKNVSALKSTTPKKRKTKTKVLSSTEILLNTLPENEIRAWLLNYLEKNKEAQLAFTLEFDTQKKEFTVADVEKILVSTIQSVIGKRKSASAAENKKITDLLNKSFEPVIEFLKQNVHTILPYEFFNATAYKLIFYSNQLYDSSTRYKKFLKEFIDKIVIQFNQIQNIEIWKKIAVEYWDTFINAKNLYFFNRDFVVSTYVYANDEQKNIIAEHCIGYIKKWIKNNTAFSVDFNSILLKIVADTNRFEEVKDFFKPLKFENEYNIILLNELSKIDPYESLLYCHAIIQNNYYEEYNEPYYQIIDGILAKIPEDKYQMALYKLLKLERGFRNFEDYDFIKNNLKDKNVLNNLEKTLLKHLNYKIFKKQNEADLLFKILLDKNDYATMLASVDVFIPAVSILPHLLVLYNFNHDKLIIKLKKRLLDVFEDYNEYEIQLLDWMIKNYDKSYFADLKRKTNFRNKKNEITFLEKFV
ncbi:hypothetical protein [Amniculibacterium aquaticum]|uniref:hypothetical protein n=1 Tax=Amniculibacterium aquaticum TaxID=2479858 RepID=UPI000F5B2988|nr:hypothetical protein [Amniculibacterium aquaticum]